MSELITRKTAEFVEAVVNEIVADCIQIASETTTSISMWDTPADMRRAIVKRLEAYKGEVAANARDQVAA